MSSTCPFTVVTPTLNAEKYLQECLASVQVQQVSGLEHVVVDGGSSDSTERIARQFRGVTFIPRPGWNQAQAIDEGFRCASGEVVAWLNADDVYADGALEIVLARFAADPGLDVLLGDCEVIGPAGESLWWERPGTYNFRRLLRHGNYLAQPAVFLRRRVFDQIGYLDESLEYAMDYELWLRVRNCRVQYVPRPLARFRWHGASKTARGQLQAWNEILRIVRRYGGGWTPHLAWAYMRCLATLARLEIASSLTGSRPMRPLTRGHNIFEHGEVARRHIGR